MADVAQTKITCDVPVEKRANQKPVNVVIVSFAATYGVARSTEVICRYAHRTLCELTKDSEGTKERCVFIGEKL
jgi:hypothetical protein